MAVTLAQLRTADTEEQALASLLDYLASVGFDVTSWQSGSVQYTILRLFAKSWSKLTGYVANLAILGFNSLASGDALDALSQDWFGNTRVGAVKAQYTETLTNASGVPYTITAGELVIGSISTGRTFRNTTGGTLPAGGTLDVTVEDEVAGLAGNVSAGDITDLQTSLAGVTATNTTRLRDGADAETDTSLRERNRTKWATLSAAGPTDAYKNWAREADSTVTRVKVDDSNPGGPGTIYIYIAGASGAIGAGVPATVQAYIDAKRPLGAIPTVYASPELSIPLTITLYVEPAYDTADTNTAVQTAIETYINGLDIGGTVLPSGPSGIVSLDQLRRAVLEVDGVVDVTFTAPASDTTLGATEVAAAASATITRTAV